MGGAGLREGKHKGLLQNVNKNRWSYSSECEMTIDGRVPTHNRRRNDNKKNPLSVGEEWEGKTQGAQEKNVIMSGLQIASAHRLTKRYAHTLRPEPT